MAMDDLGELKRSFEELKAIYESQELRVRHHEARSQNVAIAYLIWERVFFAMTQTSSSLECADWGVILAVSLSCTFLYFLFFLDTVVMLYRTQYQLDIICKEQTQLCKRILGANASRSMEAGDSSDGFRISFHVRILEYNSFRIVERKVYICSTVCALLAVTITELYACKYSLCNLN